MDGWMDGQMGKEGTAKIPVRPQGQKSPRGGGQEGPDSVGLAARYPSRWVGGWGVHIQTPSAKTSGTKLSPPLGAWRTAETIYTKERVTVPPGRRVTQQDPVSPDSLFYMG